MAKKATLFTHRAGLLVPSSNTMLETDFHQFSPLGWSTHSARMYLEDISIRALARMLDDFAPNSACDLASTEPDIVFFGSCSAAALRGNEAEEILIHRMEEIVHAPVISAMKAIRQTLKNLHISRIVVITPYVNEINQQIRASLEHDAINVLRIEGFSLSRCSDMARLPGDQIMNLARLIVNGVQPEALVICGTNLPVLGLQKDLQTVLHCPVITANQVLLEQMIKSGN